MMIGRLQMPSTGFKARGFPRESIVEAKRGGSWLIGRLRLRCK